MSDLSSTDPAHGESRPSPSPHKRSILVGVDGSQDGLRAVEFGARTAATLGAELHLVHAVDDAVLAGAWGVVYDPGVLQQAGEQATQRAVAAAEAVGLPTSQIRAEVVLGNASAVLTKLSENATEVIVGRRSVSGLERMFVGSTSLSVASTAKCPVVVISSASTPNKTGAFAAIGVGVDSHEPGLATLRHAFEMAQHRGTKLIVLTVQASVPAGMSAEQLNEQQRQLVEASSHNIERALNQFRVEFPQVSVEVRIGFGHPADELLNLSREVDLLVVGMRAPRILGYSIGGVARAVLAHSSCPLCVVR